MKCTWMHDRLLVRVFEWKKPTNNEMTNVLSNNDYVVQGSVHGCTIDVSSITDADTLNRPNHFKFSCGDEQ